MRLPSIFRAGAALFFGLAAAMLGSCADKNLATVPARADADGTAATTRALRSKVDTIVVIFAENRAFDNLYGHFPGARGLNEVLDGAGRPLPSYKAQVDRDGTVLPVLPPAWGGVTAAGAIPVVTQQQSAGLPNAPCSFLSTATAHLPL